MLVTLIACEEERVTVSMFFPFLLHLKSLLWRGIGPIFCELADLSKAVDACLSATLPTHP